MERIFLPIHSTHNTNKTAVILFKTTVPYFSTGLCGSNLSQSKLDQRPCLYFNSSFKQQPSSSIASFVVIRHVAHKEFIHIWSSSCGNLDLFPKQMLMEHSVPAMTSPVL